MNTGVIIAAAVALVIICVIVISIYLVKQSKQLDAMKSLVEGYEAGDIFTDGQEAKVKELITERTTKFQEEFVAGIQAGTLTVPGVAASATDVGALQARIAELEAQVASGGGNPAVVQQLQQTLAVAQQQLVSASTAYKEASSKNAELEAEITKLKAEQPVGAVPAGLEEYEHQIEQYKAQLTQSETKVAELESTVAELGSGNGSRVADSAELESLREVLMEKESRIADLSTKLLAAEAGLDKASLDEAKVQNGKLLEDIDKLTVQVQGLQANLSIKDRELQQTTKSKDDTITGLQAQIDELKGQLELGSSLGDITGGETKVDPEVQRELEATKLKLEEAEGKVVAITAELGRTKTQLDESKIALQEANGKLKESTGEDLTEEVTGLREQVTVLEKQLSIVSSEKTGLSARVVELLEKVAGLEEQTVNGSQVSAEPSIEAIMSSELYLDACNEVTLAQDEMNEAKRQRDAVQVELNGVKAEKSELERKIEMVQSECDKIAADRSDVQDKLAASLAELKESKEACEKFSARIAKLETDAEVSAAAVKELERIADEKQSLELQVSGLTETLNVSQKQLEKSKEELAALESKLTSIESEFNGSKAEVDRAKAEAQEAKQNAASVCGELRDTQIKLKDTEAAFTAKCDELTFLESSIAGLKDQLAVANKELKEVQDRLEAAELKSKRAAELESELKEVRIQSVAKQGETEKLNSQIAELTKELEEAKSKMEEAAAAKTRELDALRNMLARKSSRLAELETKMKQLSNGDTSAPDEKSKVTTP